jgi:molybdopterin synthase catalytic subunit
VTALEKKYGHSLEKWNKAKEEATAAMVRRARVRGMIPYSDLVAEIRAITFHAHDSVFHQMLGEISVEEDAAGRGMLSVIVVHKHGDMQPGPGFFELAQSLGHKTKDVLEFWVSELRKVHGSWSKKK